MDKILKNKMKKVIILDRDLYIKEEWINELNKSKELKIEDNKIVKLELVKKTYELEKKLVGKEGEHKLILSLCCGDICRNFVITEKEKNKINLYRDILEIDGGVISYNQELKDIIFKLNNNRIPYYFLIDNCCDKEERYNLLLSIKSILGDNIDLQIIHYKEGIHGNVIMFDTTKGFDGFRNLMKNFIKINFETYFK